MTNESAWKLPVAGDVTRVFLARHGATAANEIRPYILQGCEMDGELTETGWAQARALGSALAHVPFAAVYASPLRRAQQTASVIASAQQLTTIPVPGLREASVGRWEGKSWESIKAEDPVGHDHFFADPVNHPHPGGESYWDVWKRTDPAMTALAAQHRGQNVLVVAHNMVNRIYLAQLVGFDLKRARQLKQANCCINVIEFHPTETQVITMNSILHLC